MSDHVCTGACTAGWAPTKKCHCRTCGDNFTTPGNFDRHRVSGDCDPASAGLQLNARGVWAQPGDDDRFGGESS